MQSQIQRSKSFIKEKACIQISNPVELFQKDYSVTENHSDTDCFPLNNLTKFLLVGEVSGDIGLFSAV